MQAPVEVVDEFENVEDRGYKQNDNIRWITKSREVRPGLTDCYTPIANVLIKGFPELSISERYVVIGLVNLFWDERVYPVSLRELAKEIQVNHTMLRSRAGKHPAEGILDKLWRLGIIGLMEGKPLTHLGNKGRIQTYIWINHHYIAERNLESTLEEKAKRQARTPRYQRITVSDITTKKEQDTVDDTNSEVVQDNGKVGDIDHTVESSRSNLTHKNSNNTKNTERESSENPGKEVPDPKPIKPLTPALDVKWCPETAVQVVEAKIGKYYRESARTKQVNAAKRMLKEDPDLTREQFVMAYDERNDDWWREHKGVLHLNHMVEKDRVHEMLDRIEGRANKGPTKTSEQKKPATFSVPNFTGASYEQMYKSAQG